MKRFQMITEADARTLDYGSTVVLVAGGHVTPLAQDTLKERRISIRGSRLGTFEPFTRRILCSARAGRPSPLVTRPTGF